MLFEYGWTLSLHLSWASSPLKPGRIQTTCSRASATTTAPRRSAALSCRPPSTQPWGRRDVASGRVAWMVGHGKRLHVYTSTIALLITMVGAKMGIFCICCNITLYNSNKLKGHSMCRIVTEFILRFLLQLAEHSCRQLLLMFLITLYTALLDIEKWTFKTKSYNHPFAIMLFSIITILWRHPLLWNLISTLRCLMLPLRPMKVAMEYWFHLTMEAVPQAMHITHYSIFVAIHLS